MSSLVSTLMFSLVFLFAVIKLAGFVVNILTKLVIKVYVR